MGSRTPDWIDHCRGIVLGQSCPQSDVRDSNKQRHSDALEYQCTVRAAETEVIFGRKFNAGIARRVGAEIQIALGILIEDVNGRRNFLVVQSEHRKNRFNAPGAAQKVARHRFGRTDRHLFGVTAKRHLDGIGFVQVAKGASKYRGHSGIEPDLR